MVAVHLAHPRGQLFGGPCGFLTLLPTGKASQVERIDAKLLVVLQCLSAHGLQGTLELGAVRRAAQPHELEHALYHVAIYAAVFPLLRQDLVDSLAEDGVVTSFRLLQNIQPHHRRLERIAVFGPCHRIVAEAILLFGRGRPYSASLDGRERALDLGDSGALPGQHSADCLCAVFAFRFIG